jgi:hypothetical protein
MAKTLTYQSLTFVRKTWALARKGGRSMNFQGFEFDFINSWADTVEAQDTPEKKALVYLAQADNKVSKIRIEECLLSAAELLGMKHTIKRLREKRPFTTVSLKKTVSHLAETIISDHNMGRKND